MKRVGADRDAEMRRLDEEVERLQSLNSSEQCDEFMNTLKVDDKIDFWTFFDYMKTRTKDIKKHLIGFAFVPPPRNPFRAVSLLEEPSSETLESQHTALHEHDGETLLAHGFAFGKRLWCGLDPRRLVIKNLLISTKQLALGM